MADRGLREARRAARRNVPVENAAGDVDYQIVDSDSSSDNKLLEEVVRAPWEGKTTDSCCLIGKGSLIMA